MASGIAAALFAPAKSSRQIFAPSHRDTTGAIHPSQANTVRNGSPHSNAMVSVAKLPGV
jgi:hypothetical protein